VDSLARSAIVGRDRPVSIRRSFDLIADRIGWRMIPDLFSFVDQPQEPRPEPNPDRPAIPP
jgi:hypothetical protein